MTGAIAARTIANVSEDEYYTAAELRAACERVIAASKTNGVVMYGDVGAGYDQAYWSPELAREDGCGTACCLHGHVALARPLVRLRPGPDLRDYEGAAWARRALSNGYATPELVLRLLDVHDDTDEEEIEEIYEEHGVDYDW